MRIDRLLIIGLSVLATSPVLAAAESCRSISSEQERLACFDREGLPVQGKRQTKGKAKEEATSSKFVDPVDSLKAENDRVSARLKGICRGC